MNILVTGANGLLGHHVVQKLLELQHEVRIIVRSTRNIHFNLSDVELVLGSFADYNTLKRAALGCDAIIHIAATTDTNLLHYQQYFDVNVNGSEQVIKVSNELLINKIVFVSTANTIGFGSPQALANECVDIQYPFSASHYAQSKLAAEKLFLAASTQRDKHIVIVNPTFVIGAMDPKPSSGKLLMVGYKKPVMFVPKGGKNFVPAVDVATVISNALTMGVNGERYLVAGKNLSFREFYSIQQQIEGYKQLQIGIPDLILHIAGWVGDLLQFVGIKTELCTMNLSQLMVQEYYDNRKSKRYLLLTESDLNTAIKEGLNWFKKQQMIDG